MANDLLIKINADAKNATKAFDDVRKQTEDLEDSLGKVALISAAAFAALTAEVFLSVRAFEEAQASSVQLSNALQNQGIFTKELKEQYDGFAKAVQAKTGIDDDAISKAQAVAQTYLGQTKITEQLTFAIADLAAAQGGDLNSAAEKIARTIGTGTNAFARQGLVISESATEAERYAKVLAFVGTKSGGLAEELNKADGYSKALVTSFGNFQEAIGARFAPVIEGARKLLIGFFDAFTNNPVLADFAVAAIAAGLAIAGMIAFVAVAVPVVLAFQAALPLIVAGVATLSAAFPVLSAAVAGFGISLNVALVGIPILIAAVIAGVVFLALNWDKSWAAIKATTVGAVTLISELLQGLGNTLIGVLTFDPTRITKGLDQLKNSLKTATAESNQVIDKYYAEQEAKQKENEVKQDQGKLDAAARQAAIERQHQANLRGIRQAEIELLRLQNRHASDDIIALKTQEIEVLKALDSQKSTDELAAFQVRRAQIVALQDQQNKEDTEKAATFAAAKAAAEAELVAQGILLSAELRDSELADLRATAQTKDDIDRDLKTKAIARQLQVNALLISNTKQFGATFASIYKVLYSDEVTAAKSAADSLVQLSQSKNAQLKAIGKAAAVTQIGIDTARGAMAVYANFQTAIPYPPVSIPLGLLAAAALVAYGAERIGQVTSAADGGLITGGTPGRDSVPALLMPGELVVPTKNFNQVVGAVQGQNQAPMDNTEMVSLLRSIDAKFSSPQITNIQGDVTADDAYIDTLVRRISDAVEFRNAQIFGVTA